MIQSEHILDTKIFNIQYSFRKYESNGVKHIMIYYIYNTNIFKNYNPNYTVTTYKYLNEYETEKYNVENLYTIIEKK